MSIDVHHELEALQGMTVPELQARYAELFGEEIRTHHKQRLVRRILWRLQALAQGDLSERARRRAAALADDAHLRLEPPKPPATPVTLPSTDQRLPAPGTVITAGDNLDHGLNLQAGSFNQ